MGLEEDDDDDWNPGAQMGGGAGVEERSFVRAAPPLGRSRPAAKIPQPYGHLFDDDDEAPAVTSFGGAVGSRARANISPQTTALELAIEEAKADGNSLFQQGRYEDALAAYKRGLAKFEASSGHLAPQHVGQEVSKLLIPLCCNAAQTVLRCKGSRAVRGSQARELADRALALDPDNVKALFRHGCARAHAEDWGRAIEDFERVLELEPNSEAAKQELEKARKHAAGTTIAPSSTSVDKDRMEDAIAGAEDDKARGNRLFQAGRYYDAYQVWRLGIEALEEFPPDALSAAARKLFLALCNNSAQALLQCSEVENAPTAIAIEMADKVLSMDPSNIKAIFRRGCAHGNNQAWIKARDDFQRVLEAEPGNEAATIELEKLQDFLPKASAIDQPCLFDAKDPVAVTRIAVREAEKFRRDILGCADSRGCVPKWCQRFNKVQVQTAAWVKKQLSDTEMLEDLKVLHGDVFSAMSFQQREDFLGACDFMHDMRDQFGDEIDELMRRR